MNLITRRTRLILWKILCRAGVRYVTVDTKQGKFKVRVGERESIGRSLFCNRQYELDFVTHALEFLRVQGWIPERGRGTVVDVGAHCGIISIGMLKMGEMAQAIAIEPSPSNFALLKHNVRLNGLDNAITGVNLGVSDRIGQAVIVENDTNSGDTQIGFHGIGLPSISIMPLGDILCELGATPDLLWMDIQGHEGYAIDGSDSWFRTIPTVMEVWPKGIIRAGMSRSRFEAILSETWDSYFLLRKDRFVGYPMSVLSSLWDELEDSHCNVIFLRRIA